MNLEEAIQTTAAIGFSAIDLACISPHYDQETARTRSQQVARWIRQSGLTVAALSLFDIYTDRQCLQEQIQSTEFFLRQAPLFETDRKSVV